MVGLPIKSIMSRSASIREFHRVAFQMCPGENAAGLTAEECEPDTTRIRKISAQLTHGSQWGHTQA